MPKPLFVIPARGGSKGIPGKNIKDFCGKPLIAYSIDAAKNCTDDYSRILFSTDDDKIAETARRYGVSTEYRRPAELATDTSGSREVMLDAMKWADKMGLDYDCVVLLQPTSPLRTADDIREASALYSDDVDMVVSVTEAASNPYYNCYEEDCATGYLHISKGDGKLTRRQQAPKAWEYNGAVYVINPKSLRKYALGEFERRIPYPMPRERSVDLDTELDWMVGEALMRKNKDKDQSF